MILRQALAALSVGGRRAQRRTKDEQRDHGEE